MHVCNMDDEVTQCMLLHSSHHLPEHYHLRQGMVLKIALVKQGPIFLSSHLGELENHAIHLGCFQWGWMPWYFLTWNVDCMISAFWIFLTFVTVKIMRACSSEWVPSQWSRSPRLTELHTFLTSGITSSGFVFSLMQLHSWILPLCIVLKETRLIPLRHHKLVSPVVPCIASFSWITIFFLETADSTPSMEHLIIDSVHIEAVKCFVLKPTFLPLLIASSVCRIIIWNPLSSSSATPHCWLLSHLPFSL